MKGTMYCTEWIAWLKEPNPKKFEKRLIEWAKTLNGKNVMLFDKSTISVGTLTKIEEEAGVYQIELSQIILEYICINDDMSILRKVFWKNETTQKPLYQIPNCWDGVIPWYAY